MDRKRSFCTASTFKAPFGANQSEQNIDRKIYMENAYR